MSETANHQNSRSRTLLTPLENFLAVYLEKKAPPLPTHFKEFVVKIFPWYINSIAALFLFGLFSLYYISIMIPSDIYLASIVMTFGDTFFVSILTKLVVISISMLAVPFLLSRKRAGWKLLFYATILSFAESIITGLFISLEPVKLGAYVLFSLTSFYILFQLRSYYK